MSKKRNKNAGSYIDFQIAVEKHEKFDSAILLLNQDWKEGKINWYSPIKLTSYKEFQDGTFWTGRFDKKSNSFWNELGNHPIERISWPKNGPRWDGIAVLTQTNGEKILLLFEAKAQKGELSSRCGAKSTKSKKDISEQLESTRSALGLKKDVDWMKPYYQFANRLVFHNYIKTNNIKVALIYVFFANDPYWTGNDYTGVKEWKEAIETEKEYFGIDNAFLESNHIYNLIIDLDSDQYKDILEKINLKLKDNKVTCGHDVVS